MMGKPLFTAGHLMVRPLTEKDAPLMADWLSDPEVARWYGGRDKVWDAAAVIAHWFDPAREYIRQCIVESDERLLGYIQFYPVEADRKPMLFGDGPDEDAWGIDLFIGLPEYWNQGIGTDLLRATISHIQDRYRPSSITIDPDVENARAIRCYEKAGFVALKRVERAAFHEGEWHDCLLMVWRG